MTADLFRRLFSMDFLVGDKGERLDGWGSRAALSEPASVEGSFSGPLVLWMACAPNAAAASFAGRSKTYRKLDETSNRLAHLLIAQGEGPGKRLKSLLGTCDVTSV